MKLEDFTRGWIIGNFEPSIIKTTELEIGILDLKAGDKGDLHWHEHHKEFNLILSGAAKIGKNLYFEGDVFIFEPFEKSNVEYMQDTKLLVIKSPAMKGDKYYA